MLVHIKIQNYILERIQQCYDLHVDECAHQNRFTSDFSAFSKKGSHLHIALISKRLELQKWDWFQTFEEISESHQIFLLSITRSVYITI